MKKVRPGQHKSNLKTDILLFISSLILTLFVLEISLRVYHRFVNNIPFGKSTATFIDKELGWKGKEVFGDTSSDKLKILILGDSFTYGWGLDQKDVYYHRLSRNLDAEVFVYAGSGYGTLQEYLSLERYYDVVDPDVILLQVCHNDFINNLWELESESFTNNNGSIRPFYVNRQIKYYYSRFPKSIAAFLWLHSRLFYAVSNRIHRLLDHLAQQGFLPSVEKVIERRGSDYKSFRKSIGVTDQIVKKLRERAGQTPIIAFTVDDRQPYLEQFRKIFSKYKIEFIERVPKAIRQAESQEAMVRIEDQAHWNKIGHRICAEVLTEKLQLKDLAIKNF